VCKNLPPLEPSHRREKLGEIERKLIVVLVKLEGCWRNPMPPTEFTRRTLPSPTNAAQRLADRVPRAALMPYVRISSKTKDWSTVYGQLQ
jgi:hypothetical protein